MALLNSAQDHLYIMLWSVEDCEFQSGRDITTTEATITSVNAADFDLDGETELLITTRSGQGCLLQLYQGVTPVFALPISAGSRPALLSVNSHLQVDVLINLNSVPTVLIYSGKGFNQVPLQAFADPNCLQGPILPLSEPHSAAAIDLNGDCLSDLFLTVVDAEGNLYFQVWLNAKNSKYCLVLSEKPPMSTGQVAFADVNRDGREDLVFPVGTDQIHVLLNSNSASHVCAFDGEHLTNFTLSDLGALTSTDLKKIITLPAPIDTGSPDFPPTLRLADMDLDGFPDLLVTLSEIEGSEVIFFHNIDGGSFSPDSSTEFEKVHNSSGLIGAFFDLDENGILDILMTAETEEGLAVYSFYNNLVEDTFHLKAVMRDGTSSCAFPGAVFTFTVTDMDMNSLYYRCTQQPQSAWFALLPPFCISGTGRTVTYVEDFYAALPLADHSSRMWTPIIPNSDLLVLPSSASTEDWKLELFANPSHFLVPCIITSLSVLALLGAFIIWRYGRERKKDRHRFT